VTVDARTDVEPGRVGAGAPGAAEQVAANATSTEGRTAATNAAASAERPAVPVRGDTSVAASWAERVVESVRVATLRGGGEMRLRLEPAGLGNIDVRISLAHDGVRASIVAEHDSTRALLRNEQHLLHAALERSDLRLAGFSVDLGSGGSNSAFADVEQQPRWPEEGAAEATPDVPPEIVTMDAPAVSGRLSVRV
jgi:flagellar hook-length control protein FliK